MHDPDDAAELREELEASAAEWWRTNRLEAPDLLKQELSSARLLLVQDAYIGGACVIGGRQFTLALVGSTSPSAC